jgi:dATP pyrophosphohydrolase
MKHRTNVLVLIFAGPPELKILLLKRVPEKGGFWQPLTGGIERGEDPLESLRRELLEETGIRAVRRIIDLDYSFTHFTPKDGVLMHQKDICFAVEVEPESGITLSSEHLDYQWCRLQEVSLYLKWVPVLNALDKLAEMLTAEQQPKCETGEN